MSNLVDILVLVAIVFFVVTTIFTYAYLQYRSVLREAKNYERGLKMVPLLVHLPPLSDDIQAGGRDERDVTDEAISQAQAMYNIIASTATKGFKTNFYGQRHIGFEIMVNKGLINYYITAPVGMIDIIKQAVAAAYPTAGLEEVEERNIFNKLGKISGTLGGELTLKKQYAFPIATYQESKRDAMRALLNALSTASREDGVGIQILLRPAHDKWTKNAQSIANRIRKDKGVKKNDPLTGLVGELGAKKIAESFWKAPESKETKPEDKQLTSAEQNLVDMIDEKTRHPGYEVLVRIVVSSNTSIQAQTILKNVVSSFALFDAQGRNGFKFSMAKNIEKLVESFILRIFPQNITKNILNSVELATLFHFPDQKNIPTSQLQRQASRQVDGPHQMLEEGFLLGYNVFRGIKKQIRLGSIDRRRHAYIIGQTGTGKSVLMENLAYQDMIDGKGFAFVDPHGDSVERLMGLVPKERVEDVIYFNPGEMEQPVGLNLFEFDTADQRDFLVQEAIGMLYRLYDPGHTGIIGPRYEHWFRNAALTLMADPQGSTFIDIPQVFNDDEYAKVKLKHVTDPTVLDFWNKEMAQTSDYHKSEMLGWFVSKFGAFLSNEMMRNIIGQTKSGFNLREIMDNKKILLVNLSKGKTGELNSQLLGMIFVMKFQAAAMGRANIPEDQRVDFSLYVDEFQNFATDSFEGILSEARKYRLSLILANQFSTQLTDKIREAIVGNVGTVISGRIGTTDAEVMQKRFSPTFTAEDLTRLPNYQTIATVMIDGVPSAPFSMALIPPLGTYNNNLATALKKLSSAKYGRPRKEVEAEIFGRLQEGDKAKEARKQALFGDSKAKPVGGPLSGGSASASRPAAAQPASFIDEWLAKRKQPVASAPAAPKPSSSAAPQATALAPPVRPVSHHQASAPVSPVQQAPAPSYQGVLPASEPLRATAASTELAPAPSKPVVQSQATPAPSSQTGTQHSTELKFNEKPKVSITPQPVNSNGGLPEPGNEIFIDLQGNIRQGGDDAKSS